MMVISLADGYGPGQNGRGDLVLILLDEALTEGLVGSHAVRVSAQRLLELRDCLVDEAHFLVRDAKVVMALVVLVVDVVGDALLEPLEHLLKVRLLVAGRRFLLGHHTCRLRTVTRTKPVAQVDEVTVRCSGAIEWRRLVRLGWRARTVRTTCPVGRRVHCRTVRIARRRGRRDTDFRW